MNKIIHKILLFAILFAGKTITAQSIQVIMSPKPSPYISDWQQHTETIKLVITNPSGSDVVVKIKCELFDGSDNLIATTVASKMPELTVPGGTSIFNAEDVFPLNAIDYKGKAVNSVAKTGRIPDDNYKLCVSLTNPQTGVVVGSSGTVCKNFNIVAFQAPTLIAPANQEPISATAINGIMFRWTPVIPKPTGHVTYKLQVWEVLEGQTDMIAIRTNQPIVEKELVEILQTQWPIDFAKPEAGKKYVWTVTPLDAEGRKLVDGNGFAEPFGFSIATGGVNSKIELLLPLNDSKIDDLSNIVFRWSNIGQPVADVKYRLKVWQLMQGQNGTQAMRSNPPIVTKDVDNISEFIVKDFLINFKTTCPCCPPYLCDFVWTIQTLNKEGNPVEDAYGNSFTFHLDKAKTTNNNPDLPKKDSGANLQQIKIVSFTVKNQLSPVIDNWGRIPGSLMLVTELPPNTHVKGIRLMVQIKAGGAIVCNNNPAGGMQVDEFTTRTFSANELISTLKGCKDLKEGNYSVCVQFINADHVAISDEVCKEFNVKANNPNESKIPTLINPENGTVFNVTELKSPITFRWTPLVPKPKEPVTYRLKVWQLMQGQNSTEAMRSNQPIVTKDVADLTETTVLGIYTGPCRPPYLCDFIWEIQALNSAGTELGRSNPSEFNVKAEKSGTIGLELPQNNAQFNPKEIAIDKGITFRWTPVIPEPTEPVTYRLKVWQLMQGQNSTEAMRSNQPIVTKDVADITETTVLGIYTGPCRPPYLCDFIWTVVGLDKKNKEKEMGISDINSFSVGSTNVGANGMKGIEPADNSIIELSAGKEMTFRWSPLSPEPTKPVIYRLKVWQLMQGQSSTDAMRTNQPIVTKDVDNITQVTVSGIYTGPCRPPYLCDFVYIVEVRDEQMEILSISNPNAFSIKENPEQGTPRNSGDPIHGVDVKLGFEKQEQIELIQSVDISIEVILKNAKGDPIHGVDIKLGVQAVNASGDPIHGVDIKLGAAEKSTNSQGDPVHGVVVKRGFNKSSNTQGDPIHGVDVKLGFESKDALADSIYSVEIIVTVNATNANGDPVHGVDVKLGAKALNHQGDPVHGVVVKLGVK